jgi:hypothetical protein
MVDGSLPTPSPCVGAFQTDEEAETLFLEESKSSLGGLSSSEVSSAQQGSVESQTNVDTFARSLDSMVSSYSMSPPLDTTPSEFGDDAKCRRSPRCAVAHMLSTSGRLHLCPHSAWFSCVCVCVCVA